MKKVLFCCLLVFAVCINQKVYACSCSGPKDPLGAFNEADVVFVGKVSAKEELADYIYAVTLEVSQTLKGPHRKSIIVHTHMHSKSCGFPFEEGGEYLVYGEKFSLTAFKPADEISVTKCGRTSKLSGAKEDLAVLEGLLSKKPWSNKYPYPYEYDDKLLVRKSHSERFVESSADKWIPAVRMARQVLEEWWPKVAKYEYKDKQYDMISVFESPSIILVVFYPVGLEGLERHVEIRMTKEKFIVLSILPGS